MTDLASILRKGIASGKQVLTCTTVSKYCFPSHYTEYFYFFFNLLS